MVGERCLVGNATNDKQAAKDAAEDKHFGSHDVYYVVDGNKVRESMQWHSMASIASLYVGFGESSGNVEFRFPLPNCEHCAIGTKHVDQSLHTIAGFCSDNMRKLGGDVSAVGLPAVIIQNPGRRLSAPPFQ